MKTFLTASWQHLIMANYAVDAELLLPYVPAGTSLDSHEGIHYISLVGFLFDNVRLMGWPIPFHQQFPEVNLRFYVKQDTGNEVKRGVVFIREIVPKPMVSLLANSCYQEPYICRRMHHSLTKQANSQTITYAWQENQKHSVSVTTGLTPIPLLPASLDEFIAEHYWGYTRLSAQKTKVYEVEHPRWKMLPVTEFSINTDFSQYGKQFSYLTKQQPASVFCALGSEITVKKAGVLTC